MYRQPGSAQSTILAGIPPDLPFLLRLKPWGYVWHHLRLVMAVFSPFGVLSLALAVVVFNSDAPTVHTDRFGDVPTASVGAGLVAFGLLAVFGVPLMAVWQVRGGPVLGADRDGVYLQPRLVRNRTLYLPWELIESASIRRSRGPHLCLKPKEAMLEEMFSIQNSQPSRSYRVRAGQAIAQQRIWESLGTNISLPVGSAPQGPQGVLDALQHWSGGRLAGYSGRG
jgi:hypothetical protein